MGPPSYLKLGSIREYKEHYQRHYCRSVVTTVDGIRVYFKAEKFGHAFYENSQRRQGPKDEFSKTRAERMDWIKATLEHPAAKLYVGWNKDKRCYDENRRVSLVYENFVVIIELSLNRQGELKGNFVSCYVADQSIKKITQSPLWNRNKCLKQLRKE